MEFSRGSGEETIIDELQRYDLILVKDSTITGAYPFTLNKTPHVLTVNGHTIYAMCAFDAIAVSAMFDVITDIHSECALSSEAIQMKIFNQKVITTSHHEVRVGISWKDPEDCAARNLCPELVFLSDPGTAGEWALQKKSSVMLTLEEAIKVSSAYFRPLIKDENSCCAQKSLVPSVNCSSIGIFARNIDSEKGGDSHQLSYQPT